MLITACGSPQKASSTNANLNSIYPKKKEDSLNERFDKKKLKFVMLSLVIKNFPQEFKTAFFTFFEITSTYSCN